MIGRTVSHYQITAQLGAGGMGVVYSARDTRLDRTVALKFIPPELTRDETTRKRFITEARAASSLQHRNICTIHDVDETPEGHLFLVMDCYDGETLRERIDRGPLPLEEALEITRQVADGLARAHQAGMVHRDIKPANVMITADGDVKILDFGLAKLAGKTRVTKTGTTLGTAAYMSPEQTRGEEVDASSDVWSVGVMLYEMLAGQRPFTGEHDLAVAYGIVNNSQAPLSAFRGDVPAGVVSLIDQCLAKNPKERFSDASLLRDTMDSVPATRSRRGRQRRLRALGILAAAAVVATIAIVFGVDRFTGDVSAQEHALAIVDFRDLRATPDPTTAASITSLLNVAMVQNSPVRVVSPSYLQDLRRRMFDDTDGPIEPGQALELARRAGATLMLAGDVSDVGGNRLVMWQLIDTKSGRTISADRSDNSNVLECADAIVLAALPHLAGILGMAPSEPAMSVEGITTTSDTAFELYSRGLAALSTHKAAEAIRDLTAALDIDSTFAMAHLALSEAYVGALSGIADVDAAVCHAEAAWRHRGHLSVKHRLLLEARRTALDGRNADAFPIYDEILERWPDDRDALVAYSNRLFYTHYYARSLDIARRGYGMYPTEVRLANTCYAASRYLGLPGEGVAVLRAATRAIPDDVNLWDSYGTALLCAGKPDSAEIAFRKALDLDPRFEFSREGLAKVVYARGDLVRAINEYQGLADTHAPGDPDRASVVAGYMELGLAGCLAEAGRCSEALAQLRACDALVESQEAWRKRIGHRVCRVLMQMGQYDDVIDYVGGVGFTNSHRMAEMQWYQGLARAEKGETAAAEAVLPVLVPSVDAGYPKVKMMSLWLEARIALAENQPALAVAKIDTLTEMGGRQLFPEEANTLVATAYHRNGRSDEAITVLKDYLRVWKGHALGHYELAKIYQDLGRPEEARSELTTFLDMWKNADEDMPQLIDARERLANLRATGT